MTNILLDTHDITMASVVRDKVDPEMSIEDIEEAMAEIAIERNIKDVRLFGLQSKRCDKASKQKMHRNDQPLPWRLLVYSIGKS
jgi:hypothetical protein